MPRGGELITLPSQGDGVGEGQTSASVAGVWQGLGGVKGEVSVCKVRFPCLDARNYSLQTTEKHAFGEHLRLSSS